MLLVSTIAPIMAVHPDTGQPINVSPLFAAIQAFDGATATPADLSASIQRAIRHINLTPCDGSVTSPQELANLNFDLYRLQDMFDAMIVMGQQAA